MIPWNRMHHAGNNATYLVDLNILMHVVRYQEFRNEEITRR
jgi:hypothetical protein